MKPYYEDAGKIEAAVQYVLNGGLDAERQQLEKMAENAQFAVDGFREQIKRVVEALPDQEKPPP